MNDNRSSQEARRSRKLVSSIPPSEKHRESTRQLEVVGLLLFTEQVGLEHVVTHVESHREPIRRGKPIAEAVADREAIVVAEIGAAGAGNHVQSAAERIAATDERFTGQDVVARG